MVVVYLLISVILIIYLSTKLKIHPFIALFIVALLYGFFAGMSLDLIISSINQGFGDTLGKIGLIIVLGIIIGSFLEPNIETGTRGRQFNVSSEQHTAGILLMKVLGKFWVLRLGIKPGTSSAAGNCLYN